MKLATFFVICLINVFLNVTSKNIFFSGLNVRSRSRKSKSSSGVQFMYSTKEFIINETEIARALNNITVENLNPCLNTTKTDKKNDENVNKTALCTDAAGYKTNTTALNLDQIKVSTCNQVLYIKGAKAIMDFDDCGSKQPAFFTMSMYFINQFKEMKPGTLRESILLEELNMPTIMPMTKKKCIDFSASTNQKRIGVCFETPEEASALYSAFLNFMKCRMGDNLKPLTISQLKQAYALSCNGKPIDPKIFTSPVKDDIVNGINTNYSKLGLNPYYPIDVPGSNEEMNRQLRQKMELQEKMNNDKKSLSLKNFNQ